MQKGICKHYNGNVFLDKSDCDAGINVRNLVGGDVVGWFRRCPCMKRHEADIVCKSYKDPTDEELNADEEEWDRIIKRVKDSMPLIRKLKEENPKGGAGTIECPVCKGEFNYTISAYNGHIHAKCETESCISFNE